jgi:hypothetical protein
MKTRVIVLCLVVIGYFQVVRGQNGAVQLWDRRFGGTNHDKLVAMITSPEGGYVLVGYSGSGQGGAKTQGSRGGYDYWIVKIDENGNKIWDKRFGGLYEDYASAVVAVPGGGYLVAGYSSSGVGGDKTQDSRGWTDYWLVKIDENGNKIWDKRFGGLYEDYASAVVAVPGGGYLVAGYSESPIGGDKTQNSWGDFDQWLVKIDEDGNKLWDRRFGGFDYDEAASVVAVPGGGYLVVGGTLSEANGDVSSSSLLGGDVWLLWIDEAGNKVWDKRYGGYSSDYASTVITLPGGGYVIAGTSHSGASGDKTEVSQGFYDYWILRVDAQGNKVWDKTFGGSGQDFLYGLVPASGGGYIVAGESQSDISGDRSEPSMGGQDYWLVKFDENGNKLWDKRFGGTSDDPATSLIALPDGHYLIGGSSNSVVSGEKSQPSQGGTDFWVVKFADGGPLPVFNLTLSPNALDENNAPNALVGLLATNAPDTSNTYTYALVSGPGDDDNASFTITGNELRAAVSFDYETQSLYSIRVRSTNQAGVTAEKIFTVFINNVIENQPPADITLLPSAIDENNALGATVGSLTTLDPDPNNTHTYTLVAGPGSGGNSAFIIVGNELRAAVSFDYETQSSYSIRVRSTDQGALSTERVFQITVNDLLENEAPVAISLFPSAINENNTPGSLVGMLTTLDPNPGNLHVYTLVAGPGDTDNAAFTIVGTELRAAVSFDFETQTSYSVRIRSADQDGLAVEQRFTIQIQNVNEAPVDLVLSNNALNENNALNAIIGTLSTTDPDAGNTFTYTVSGTDAPFFNINGLELRASTVFDFEARNTYELTIRTTDQGGLSFDKTFSIVIYDVNEPTTGLNPIPDQSAGMKVYPNPTTGWVRLTFDVPVSGTLRVLDAVGKVVLTQPLVQTDAAALDFSTQPPGVYFIEGLGRTAKLVVTQ